MWAGTLVPPTSMDSANRTRLWVGLGLQWGPDIITQKVQPRCSPSSSFLLTLQFYVIATTVAQALSRVLFSCRDTNLGFEGYSILGLIVIENRNV